MSSAFFLNTALVYSHPTTPSTIFTHTPGALQLKSQTVVSAANEHHI
jgi:hypothetical protein